MIDVLWCRVLVKDKIHFILPCLNFLRFQASRPSIAMDVAFVRTSAAKPATELSMQRAWGRPAGTCRRIVARDAEQGNEASCVTNHLFLRHVSPMNWAGRQFSQSTFNIMFIVHLSLPEAQIAPIFPKKKKKPFTNHAPTSCRKPSCEVAPSFPSDFLNRSCDHHGGHRHAGHEAHFG